MRDVRERINLLEQDQRRSAEVVRELQSQSQAATVAQLTDDMATAAHNNAGDDAGAVDDGGGEGCGGEAAGRWRWWLMR